MLSFWEIIMKLRNPFRDLTGFELILWLLGILATAISFAASGFEDPLTAIASLIGVTALIFVAKGYVFGQILTVVFSLFYGIISFYLKYYGEMITYLGMSAPIAMFTVIEWLRHPYKGTKEVEIVQLPKKRVIFMIISTAAITIAFYFILGALGNASLTVSTVSVTTSFLASFLLFSRSPYYALAYAANDIVLIILWVIAAVSDMSYLPMVMCFVMFLANDIYGFINWKRMQNHQKNP